MRLRLYACLLSILLPLTTAVAAAHSATQKEAEGRREWEQLLKRFNEQRSYNLITSGMWTLTHAAESKKEVEEVMRLLILLTNSFAKQDPALLDELGGAKGFKDKMAA